MTSNRIVDELVPESSSFRDPSGRVYHLGSKILRGVDENTAENMRQLLELPFFKKMLDSGELVATKIVAEPSEGLAPVADGRRWSLFLEHEQVPFITYPYEWTFSMLQDAALLQLRLVENSLEHGWTLKDASAFNIQWIGPHPVFIDIGSFEPWTKGEPWVGYRQFCAMFLTPLMLRAYLGIDHISLMRSRLEGIDAGEALKMLRGVSRFRKGVLSHIVFPAMVERSIAKRERDAVPAKHRASGKQTEAMVIGLVQSLTRVVKSLSPNINHTDWSHYDKTHTYKEPEYEKKKIFVERHVSTHRRRLIWDIGCNTGTYSKIAAPHADHVLSMDSDHDAVEQLYLSEKENRGSNILPLVMNLANPSPAQGWRCSERKMLEQRGKPDLVMCLALIHHIRISANIPLDMFLDWLRSLECDVIIEFVDRHDEMVVKLLTNKKEQYQDYTRDEFERLLKDRFVIKDREELKEGRRIIYMASPSS